MLLQEHTQQRKAQPLSVEAVAKVAEDVMSAATVLPKTTRPPQANKPERSRPRPSGLWVDTKIMNNSSAPSSAVGSPTSAKVVPTAPFALSDAQTPQHPKSPAPSIPGSLTRSLSMSAATSSLRASLSPAPTQITQEKVLTPSDAGASGASAAASTGPLQGELVLNSLNPIVNLQGTYGDVLLIERPEVGKIPGAQHLLADPEAMSQRLVVKNVPLTQRKNSQHGKSELAVLRKRLHLESDNIVKLEYACDMGDSALIVLEYCEQGDLYSVWGCDEALRTCEHLVILADVARGLDCLHRHNIIHGDLKPENVGISQQGTAKLLDFGLSTTLDPARHTNRTNGRLECVTQSGTIAYAGPEIFKRKPHGTESDWWSFAVLAFEALFANWPWYHEDDVTMCDLICQAPVEVPDFLETREAIRTPMSLRTFFAASFRKAPHTRLGYRRGFEEIQASRFWTELAPWWTWDPSTAYGSTEVGEW
ncbi:Protein kinase, putative [Hondaea fermentalgiana]|uniref:Protein kinase, putative n=1 Tax=Hondaea fermentalgiana TaxID=2315210 RepID=A0A2R5GGP2_9STRA|nr:Protein kinase, putative [Hondaea fermentalgiana]|eukprot:GBG30052.1 Protein kinase, putative [Hondaea fermentalgiana]